MISRIRLFKRVIIAVTGLAASASASASLCLAQEGPAAKPESVYRPGSGTGQRLPVGLVVAAPNDPVASIWMKINSLKSDFAAAKSDEEQASAKSALQAALSEAFDLSMTQRKDQIDELTIRAANVQDKLEKRLTAKNDMIALQMRAYLIDGPDSSGFAGPGSLTPVPGDELNSRIHEYQAAHAKENSDEMKKTSEQLHRVLEQHFETDMQRRQKELEEIRSQLTRLEKQLQFRAAKKDEIVSLRLQLAINEAQGLGLFGESSNPSFVHTSGPGMPVSSRPAGSWPQSRNYFQNQSLPVAVPPGGAIQEFPYLGVREWKSKPVATTPSPKISKATSASPQTSRAVAAARAVKTGQLMITIEPTEPALLAIDVGSGKVVWKNSLKEIGLPVSERLEVEDDAVLLHTREGGALKIHSLTGKILLQLKSDEVRTRALLDTERQKAGDPTRSNDPKLEQR